MIPGSIHHIRILELLAVRDSALEIIMGLLCVFVIVGLFVHAAQPTKKEVKAQEAVDRLRPDRMKWLLANGVTGPILHKAPDGHVLSQNWNGPTHLFLPGYSSGMVLDYETLMSAEVIEDGVSVTAANRTRQIGSAIVGGAIAGGVGAVIGGLGTTKTARDHVNKVIVRMSLNNTRWPLIEISFLDVPGNGLPKSSQVYLKARSDAVSWCSRLEIAMRTNQSEAEDPQAVSSGAPEAAKPELQATDGNSPMMDDVLGRLERLAKMKEAGHLSDSEFESQKKSLLNPDS